MEKQLEEKSKLAIVTRLPETIIIKTGVLEALIQSEQLLNKTFPVKVNYWLARVFQKARQEFRPYMKSKQALIDKYTETEEEKIVREKAEGIRPMSQGQFFIPTVRRDDFNKELEELVHTEIDFGIHRIAVEIDKLPPLTLKEMELLIDIFDMDMGDKKE